MSFLIFLIFTPILVAILLGLNALLSISRPDVQKLSVFECGLGTILNQTRSQFNISYYLVAILFLLFDLEILLIYPLALTINFINFYGFWIAVFFFTILTFGFVVELSYGALSFNTNTEEKNKNNH